MPGGGAAVTSMWGPIGSAAGGELPANEFLSTAKMYAEKATPDEATLLEAVASHLMKANKCALLVYLMVLSQDPARITSTNPNGFTLWMIEHYDSTLAQFRLKEQLALDGKIVHLSVHQLRETAVLTTYRLRVLSTERKKMVARDGTLQPFTDVPRLRGLQVEHVTKEGRLLYSIRSCRKDNASIAQFTVKNVNQPSKSSSSSSSSGTSSTIAAVAFSPDIMKITEKQHGKLTVSSLVQACRQGPCCGGPSTPGGDVMDYSCNLTHGQMTQFLGFQIPDVRYFTSCSNEAMAVASLDKARVPAVLRLMGTAEVVACLKCVVELLSRWFGFNERILRNIQVVALRLVDFEFDHAILYPRFGSNGSAAILVNEMLGALSAALTNPATSVRQLELAIDFRLILLFRGFCADSKLCASRRLLCRCSRRSEGENRRHRWCMRRRSPCSRRLEREGQGRELPGLWLLLFPIIRSGERW